MNKRQKQTTTVSIKAVGFTEKLEVEARKADATRIARQALGNDFQEETITLAIPRKQGGTAWRLAQLVESNELPKHVQFEAPWINERQAVGAGQHNEQNHNQETVVATLQEERQKEREQRSSERDHTQRDPRNITRIWLVDVENTTIQTVTQHKPQAQVKC